MKKAYNSVDFTKIIMAVFVVAIHTKPLENCQNGAINSIYESIVAIAVPFFFIASGFLLANKFDNEFATENNFNSVKKTLLYITKLYLIWTCVYLPMTIYHFVTSENSFIKNVLLFIRGFVFEGQQYNSWPLWYLLSTVYALIFLLVMIKIKSSRKLLMIVSAVFLVLSCAICYLASIENVEPKALRYLQSLFELSIGNGRILKGAFYIPLGVVLQRKNINPFISAVIFAVGLALSVCVKITGLGEVFTAITAWGLFEIVIQINLPNSAVYPWLRKMSTAVYFIHMYVWTFYYMVVYGEKTQGADSFLFTVAVSLLIAFVYVWVTTKHLKTNKKGIKKQICKHK